MTGGTKLAELDHIALQPAKNSRDGVGRGSVSGCTPRVTQRRGQQASNQPGVENLSRGEGGACAIS